MDKRDIKDFLIIAITTLAAIFFGFMLLLGIITSIGQLLSGDSIKDIIIQQAKGMILPTLIFVFMIAIIGFIIFVINILIKARLKKDSIVADNYIRQLPKYFPPAIASILLDLNIETETDYTATIAYLISKKYITLSDNAKEVKTLIENPDFKTKHEEYVFHCVTKQSRFDKDEFRKLIYEDAKEMGLIQKGERKVHIFRNIFICIIGAIIFGQLSDIINNEIIKNLFAVVGLLFFVSILGVVGYSIYIAPKSKEEMIKRTIKGNKEAKKWAGLKKYINNYTLMSERDIADTTIFEDYIAYAIALNEAKAVEKFIQQNENYRTLIYGRASYLNEMKAYIEKNNMKK